MDTVTYPDPTVAAELEQHFSPLKIDMLARHPDFKEASGATKVIWAPTMIFTDAKGRELRRWVGWLPPEHFRAELAFVRATAEFQNVKFEGARDGFARVVEEFPTAPLKPEALYWLGIAGFLAGGKDFAHLSEVWGRLARDHSDTQWGIHASVIEDAPK